MTNRPVPGSPPYGGPMPDDPASRPFSQVDVFTAEPYRGNPVAVVHDADGLTDAQMAAFARWTNLSETTFLLRPTDPAAADYRLRIFTPGGELPFAGHPTLGSCHAWLAAGGRPARGGTIVQECGVGPVVLRRGAGGLQFAAPAPREDAPVDAATLDRVRAALALPADAVVDHRLLDNGPRWHVLLLDSADRVLGLRPDWAAIEGVDVGVVGPHPEGAARRRSRCAGSPRAWGSPRTRSPGASTPRSGSGSSAPAGPRSGTSRRRAPRSAARAGSTSSGTPRARCGSAATP